MTDEKRSSNAFPEPLPSPLPEWLWIGRVVRCAYVRPIPFDGEGAIIKHGHTTVLVKPYNGDEAVWLEPRQITPSGGGQRPNEVPSNATEACPYASDRYGECTLSDEHEGPHKYEFGQPPPLRSNEAPPIGNPDTLSRWRARQIIAKARLEGDVLDFGMGLEMKIMAALDEQRANNSRSKEVVNLRGWLETICSDSKDHDDAVTFAARALRGESCPVVDFFDADRAAVPRPDNSKGEAKYALGRLIEYEDDRGNWHPAMVTRSSYGSFTFRNLDMLASGSYANADSRVRSMTEERLIEITSAPRVDYAPTLLDALEKWRDRLKQAPHDLDWREVDAVCDEMTACLETEGDE